MIKTSGIVFLVLDFFQKVALYNLILIEGDIRCGGFGQ